MLISLNEGAGNDSHGLFILLLCVDVGTGTCSGLVSLELCRLAVCSSLIEVGVDRVALRKHLRALCCSRLLGPDASLLWHLASHPGAAFLSLSVSHFYLS